jgi:hypothetical protein
MLAERLQLDSRGASITQLNSLAHSSRLFDPRRASRSTPATRGCGRAPCTWRRSKSGGDPRLGLWQLAPADRAFSAQLLQLQTFGRDSGAGYRGGAAAATGVAPVGSV